MASVATAAGVNTSDVVSAGPRQFLDMHTHIACFENPQIDPSQAEEPGDHCYVSPEMKSSFKFGIYMKAFGVTDAEVAQKGRMVVFDKLAEKIKESKRVGRSVVLGIDGFIDRKTGKFDWDQTQVYVPNEIVLKGVSARKDLFLYGPSINPYRKDAIARLKQAKIDGAVLIKWIPSIMNIDPSDPNLDDFYRTLKELNLPLLVHTGKESTFMRATDDNCNPALLKYPLDKGVKIIAAHAATCGESDNESDCSLLKGLFLNEKYIGQLYADISATTQINRVRALASVLADPAFKGRLLYGTDWPLIDVRVFGVSLSPFLLYYLPGFGLSLSWEQIKELFQTKNSFDRDVRLKEFLGVPPDTFVRAEEVLGV